MFQVEVFQCRHVLDAGFRGKKCIAVLYLKRLACLCVDVGHRAVGIIVDHIHERGIEYGVVAQRQLVGIRFLASLVGDVFLYAKDHDAALRIVFQHGNIDVEDSLPLVVFIVGRTLALHDERSLFLFSVLDVLNDLQHITEVVMVVEHREADGRVAGTLLTMIQEKREILRVGMISPYLRFVVVKHQCQLGVLLLCLHIGDLLSVVEYTIGENHDKHCNQQSCY